MSKHKHKWTPVLTGWVCTFGRCRDRAVVGCEYPCGDKMKPVEARCETHRRKKRGKL